MNLKMVEAADDVGMAKLRRIESRIKDGDSKGLRARWESGKLLREFRETNPEKTLEDWATDLGRSASELGYRVRFAESEDALTNAVGKGWSWHDVAQHMGELVGRQRAAKKGKRPVVVKEFSLMLRRIRTALRKVHAADLTEADFKALDVLQEEIARIYDEIGASK